MLLKIRSFRDAASRYGEMKASGGGRFMVIGVGSRCDCMGLVGGCGSIKWSRKRGVLGGSELVVYLPCNYEYDLICRNNKRSELGN